MFFGKPERRDNCIKHCKEVFDLLIKPTLKPAVAGVEPKRGLNVVVARIVASRQKSKAMGREVISHKYYDPFKAGTTEGVRLMLADHGLNCNQWRLEPQEDGRYLIRLNSDPINKTA